jgi:hypothetical protein
MAGGRPKKEIDYELVGKLAEIQCTHEEIASILGISRQTLSKDEEFLYIYSSKKEAGRSSLRRMQWKTAESGNPTMQIWLGKQWLGQSDKQDVNHSGDIEIKFEFDD